MSEVYCSICSARDIEPFVTHVYIAMGEIGNVGEKRMTLCVGCARKFALLIQYLTGDVQAQSRALEMAHFLGDLPSKRNEHWTQN